jgi:Glycine/D-amino acid oxidases (deaminating)
MCVAAATARAGSFGIVYNLADYASLAPIAFHYWNELQANNQAPLLQMTGGISIDDPQAEHFQAIVQALETIDAPYRIYDKQEAAQAFPQFRLPDGWVVLEQKGAGILHASNCVRAMADGAVAAGAELREECRVLSVQPDGEGVLVRFASAAGEESATAGHAIVTAGPWAAGFFQQLGLQIDLPVLHQQVVYYEVEDPDSYAVGRCPLYLYGQGKELPGFYGFPIWERPGQIKVAVEMAEPPIDPESPPHPVDQKALALMNRQVEELMVGVRPNPTDVITCRYTMSPDRDFIIDRHPEYPQIVLASPCSGHGFKFTITTGRLVADLVQSAPGDYSSPVWRERFALKRLLAA